MNNQERLLYITNLRTQEMENPFLRGVTAYWKGDTACLSFYFENAPTEKDIEEASDVCGEVIASFPEALLEEHYIEWGCNKPLPNKFLAYRKK